MGAQIAPVCTETTPEGHVLQAFPLLRECAEPAYRSKRNDHRVDSSARGSYLKILVELVQL